MINWLLLACNGIVVLFNIKLVDKVSFSKFLFVKFITDDIQIKNKDKSNYCKIMLYILKVLVSIYNFLIFNYKQFIRIYKLMEEISYYYFQNIFQYKF